MLADCYGKVGTENHQKLGKSTEGERGRERGRRGRAEEKEGKTERHLLDSASLLVYFRYLTSKKLLVYKTCLFILATQTIIWC